MYINVAHTTITVQNVERKYFPTVESKSSDILEAEKASPAEEKLSSKDFKSQHALMAWFPDQKKIF